MRIDFGGSGGYCWGWWDVLNASIVSGMLSNLRDDSPIVDICTLTCSQDGRSTLTSQWKADANLKAQCVVRLRSLFNLCKSRVVDDAFNARYISNPSA